ncbi:MAG: hypothetical protein JWN38_458 [Candidatus Saccharibacteria bacterium]|nr:hypothetical protein [Candidatus Saccharibacteria bacterium]
MPLFKTLGRLLKGQPPYQPQDDMGYKVDRPNDDAEFEKPANRTPQYAADTNSGAKVLPAVLIEEIKSHVSGNQLECYGYVRNESPYNVSLDKVTLFGSKREIDATLKAGERREFLLYAGPTPTSPNNHIADLQFFDANHDYFVSHHDVLLRHHDTTYDIERIHFTGLTDI